MDHPLRIDLRYGAESAAVGCSLIWATTPAGTAYKMYSELGDWAEQFTTDGWTPRWARFRTHGIDDLCPELLEPCWPHPL